MELEPSAQPISKVDFEFEGRKLTKAGVREMIYREVCNHFRSGWNICYSVSIGFLIFSVQTDFGVPSTDASGVHRRWRADSLPISKVKICTIDFNSVQKYIYHRSVLFMLVAQCSVSFNFFGDSIENYNLRITLYVLNSCF